MKLWQLVSIFKDEEYLIRDELLNPKWKIYLIIYENLDFFIKHQKREFLDLELEEDFLISICKKSKKVIFISSKTRDIYSYQNDIAIIKINILEAIYIYDHNSIEEVFEKTHSVGLPFTH